MHSGNKYYNHQMYKTSITVSFFILLILNTHNYSNANEMPTGRILMQACEAMLNDQADQLNVMLCNWYVTPCDCHYGKPEALPKVCLPESVDSNLLAAIIVEQLEKEIDLQQLSAEEAAAKILAPIHPCVSSTED